jgi:methylthioribose-1-phosphate isomerase
MTECIEAIKILRVRGAPAIGICAAYGLYLAAQSLSSKTHHEFRKAMDAICDLLYNSRPTAVNLGWAIQRIKSLYHANNNKPLKKVISFIRAEAIKIHLEDREFCQQMGHNGLEVVPNPGNILTHCKKFPVLL